MKSKIAAMLPFAALWACTPPASAPPVPSAYPAKLRLIGTEPFWSIDLDNDRLTYSSAAQPEKRTARIARSEAGGELRLTGSILTRPISARIVRATCSDGMSDRVYAYSAKVTYGDETLAGCADQT
jgi:uncharacterized membrane protein